MELTVAIIGSIAGIVTAIISASAYVRSRREEVKEKAKAKKDSVRQRLALQVIGYHCEESLLAEELSKYTNETPKQIKEFRKCGTIISQNDSKRSQRLYC